MVRERHDPLISVSRRAMACLFEVCFPAAGCADGTRLALDALDRVQTLEKQLSYFQPDSKIAEINRSAAHAPVEVETWLFDLLALAKRLHEETAGAYDAAAAPLWEAWGFARRAGKIPSDEQLALARSQSGSHLLELDAQRRTVRFLAPGVKINLGGIGKGYALDECARRLLDSGMNDFLIHGGQSSVLAKRAAERSPWEVGIADPRRPGRRLGVLRLHDRALGTSAAQFQSFRHRGRRYGHVIDPRTGWPADLALSTTAVAPTAALADALSTAFHVMGPEEAAAYCRPRPEIGLFMLCPGPGGGEAEIVAAGLDNNEWLP